MPGSRQFDSGVEPRAKYVHLLIMKLYEAYFGQLWALTVTLQSFDQQDGSSRTCLASEALSSTIFLGSTYPFTIYNTVVGSPGHDKAA